MGRKPDDDDGKMAGGTERQKGAVLVADAAVRRSLIEGRRIVIAFLTRRVGADEAEEVFQRFAVRALERAEDLRDIRSLHPWLSRILMSTTADHLRHRGRRRQRERPASESELESVGGLMDPEANEAVCVCLYKILPTLRPAYAEIIWRVDLLGEPRERTAASLGIGLANLNVRLHRGRLALRRRLEEMCLTCPVHGFLDCQCEEAERVRKLHVTERQKGKDQTSTAPSKQTASTRARPTA